MSLRATTLVLLSCALGACGSRSGLPDVSSGDAAPPPDGGAGLGHVLIFGGVRGDESPELDDTWLWDGETWSHAHPAKSPQACDSFAITGLGGGAVMVGGYDTGVLYHETWTWNGVTWAEHSPAKFPPHRFLGALAPSGNGALLFGGKDLNFLALGDTWRWDGSSWTELHPGTSPGPRLGHAMVAVGDEIVLFGGLNDNLTHLSDTWIWDGNTWTAQSPPVSPPGRALHAMAALGSHVVLFGGTGFDAAGASVTYDDTWIWDGHTWTKLMPPDSPPARDDFTLATLSDEVVLFGGIASGPFQPSSVLGDTWTWDGNTWTARQPALSPPPRFAHGAASVR